MSKFKMRIPMVPCFYYPKPVEPQKTLPNTITIKQYNNGGDTPIPDGAKTFSVSVNEYDGSIEDIDVFFILEGTKENPKYEAELKKYNLDMKRYEKALAVHNKKLKQYKEDKKVYDKQVKENMEINEKANYERLKQKYG